MNDIFILIATQDARVQAEASATAAAAGLDSRACSDPRDIARWAPRAAAVLADAATASHVAACTGQGRAHPGSAAPPVYFVVPDPGPLDYEAALRCHARAAFILPAESTGLLAALREAASGAVGPDVYMEELEARGQRSGRGGPSLRRGAGVRGEAGRGIGKQMRVAVVGAVGGVGASTLAACLARAMSPALLIDGAPRHGGLDLLLGVEDVPGARWPDLNVGEGAVAGEDLRRALPVTAEGITLLSAAREGGWRGAENSAAWEHKVATLADAATTEPVIIDGVVPDNADVVVLVTAAEVRAAAAAAGWTQHLAERGLRTLVVLRHRGWSALSVDEVERVIHADVVAEVKNYSSWQRKIEEEGLPPALPRGMRQACARVLEEMGWAA